MLAAYCETVVLNRRLAGMVAECGADDPRWPELARTYHADVGVLVRLGSALRLTPQATRLQDQAKIDPDRGARPWDDANLGEAGGDGGPPN